LGDAVARNALDRSDDNDAVRSRPCLTRSHVIPEKGFHPLRLGAAFSSVNPWSSKFADENEQRGCCKNS
jgi:hypothetical protein